ncbi:MAG: Hsp20/alpha crystallin family protein [Ideonella sp.]|jgi:HSP20 family protein|nr:Hsp20/alpha crystallin family protein [Ideonella sp.]
MFLVPMSRRTNELGRSMDRLFDEQLFDRFFAPMARPDALVARSPALDVTEADNAFSVKLDMPGVTKDDVKITIDGKRVTVTASASTADEKKEGERVVYSERTATSYARSFDLPVELNEAESSAKLEHGVLNLTLAKRGAGKSAQITVS